MTEGTPHLTDRPECTPQQFPSKHARTTDPFNAEARRRLLRTHVVVSPWGTTGTGFPRAALRGPAMPSIQLAERDGSKISCIGHLRNPTTSGGMDISERITTDLWTKIGFRDASRCFEGLYLCKKRGSADPRMDLFGDEGDENARRPRESLGSRKSRRGPPCGTRCSLYHYLCCRRSLVNLLKGFSCRPC